jgi:hypothetical protein
MATRLTKTQKHIQKRRAEPPRTVKEWWGIECLDGTDWYCVGGCHATYEIARRYLEHGLTPKRLAKRAVIVRHEEIETIEPILKDP